MSASERFMQQTVRYCVMQPTPTAVEPVALRAVKTVPDRLRASSDRRALRKCEEWSFLQDNTPDGNAKAFAMAFDLYRNNTELCRAAAGRILERVTKDDQSGLTPNRLFAAALVLDSLNRPRQARRLLQRSHHATLTLRANGVAVADPHRFEDERLRGQYGFWRWLCRPQVSPLPQEFEFEDPHTGHVHLALHAGKKMNQLSVYQHQSAAAKLQRYAWRSIGKASPIDPSPALTRKDVFHDTVGMFRRELCNPWARVVLADPKRVFAACVEGAAPEKPLSAGTQACWLGSAVGTILLGTVTRVVGVLIGTVVGACRAILAPPNQRLLKAHFVAERLAWERRVVCFESAVRTNVQDLVLRVADLRAAVDQANTSVDRQKVLQDLRCIEADVARVESNPRDYFEAASSLALWCSFLCTDLEQGAAAEPHGPALEAAREAMGTSRAAVKDALNCREDGIYAQRRAGFLERMLR